MIRTEGIMTGGIMIRTEGMKGQNDEQSMIRSQIGTEGRE